MNLPPGVKPIPKEWIPLIQLCVKNTLKPPNYVQLSHDMDTRDDPTKVKLSKVYDYLVFAQNQLWQVERKLENSEYDCINSNLQSAKETLDAILTAP
jgi:hypothetical protein